MNVTLKQPKNNYTELTLGDVTLYFSYETVIAFKVEGNLTISENVWGVTTGKHLNYVDRDKSIRIAYEEFEEELEKLLNRLVVEGE